MTGYIDHTVLISSELVTNALRHGAGIISIRLYRARRDLRVEVHDHGAGHPAVGTPEPPTKAAAGRQ